MAPGPLTVTVYDGRREALAVPGTPSQTVKNIHDFNDSSTTTQCQAGRHMMAYYDCLFERFCQGPSTSSQTSSSDTRARHRNFLERTVTMADGRDWFERKHQTRRKGVFFPSSR
eukprot:756656-Hanusia_phi.AAC.1